MDEIQDFGVTSILEYFSYIAPTYLIGSLLFTIVIIKLGKVKRTNEPWVCLIAFLIMAGLAILTYPEAFNNKNGYMTLFLSMILGVVIIIYRFAISGLLKRRK